MNEVVGFIGVFLTVLAYFPQLYHLESSDHENFESFSMYYIVLFFISNFVLFVYAMTKNNLPFILVSAISVVFYFYMILKKIENA